MVINMDNQSGRNAENASTGRSADNVTILRAVNKAAELLLTANEMENIDDILITGLDIIGRALNVDRVHIWRDEQNEEGAMQFRRLYTWLGEVGTRSPEVTESVTSPFDNFPEWRQKLLRGEFVGGVVSSLSHEAQVFFSKFKIKSVFIIPIQFSDVFWGFVSIDDCEHERNFSDDEIAILKSFSLMVASAINHRNMVLNLINTNALAEAATIAKNAFLSNMSHEVRTPLNAIVGMAAVGKNAASTAEKDHALGKIGDASAHLLGIISNVLDMARIEEGKLELIPIEFNFRDMLSKAVSSVKSIAGEKNQSVAVNISSDIPHSVIGDDARLSQLVLNILSNSVKFTPAYGKITLDASVASDGGDTFELQVVIQDNGIGIDDDRRGSLFKAFEQANGALNRDYGGTGLGLPISKHIVELMGGRIWVTSELGRGTTVVFTVHLKKGQADDSLKYDAEAAGGHEDVGLIVPGEFKGKRLLVVEDIEINREILIALLKSTELIIECAEDGQVALDMVMFNVEKYDAVFMDLQMPNMDGLESARRIRELPERKRGRLPIIAMTANVLAEDINACYDAGMDDHLSKPLDIEKVLEMLRKYLS